MGKKHATCPECRHQNPMIETTRGSGSHTGFVKTRTITYVCRDSACGWRSNGYEEGFDGVRWEDNA